MSDWIFYGYSRCSTCRDALKWLSDNGIAVQQCEIRETPPSLEELEIALKTLSGAMTKLLNTSSQDYRAIGLKERVPKMTAEEVFALIQENGNLCKRPFLIHTSRRAALVGFKLKQWQEFEW